MITKRGIRFVFRHSILPGMYVFVGVYILRCLAHVLFDIFNPDVPQLMPNLFQTQIADVALTNMFICVLGTLDDAYEYFP